MSIQKKTVVQRSLKQTAQQNTGLDVAVGNYLTLVGPGVLPIAADLDADIAAIITQANTVNTALRPVSTARGDPVNKLKVPLVAALVSHLHYCCAPRLTSCFPPRRHISQE